MEEAGADCVSICSVEATVVSGGVYLIFLGYIISLSVCSQHCTDVASDTVHCTALPPCYFTQYLYIALPEILYSQITVSSDTVFRLSYVQ